MVIALAGHFARRPGSRQPIEKRLQGARQALLVDQGAVCCHDMHVLPMPATYFRSNKVVLTVLFVLGQSLGTFLQFFRAGAVFEIQEVTDWIRTLCRGMYSNTVCDAPRVTYRPFMFRFPRLRPGCEVWMCMCSLLDLCSQPRYNTCI